MGHHYFYTESRHETHSSEYKFLHMTVIEHKKYADSVANIIHNTPTQMWRSAHAQIFRFVSQDPVQRASPFPFTPKQDTRFS